MSYRDTVRDFVAGDQAGLLNTATPTGTDTSVAPVQGGTSCLSDTLDLYTHAQGFVIHAAGVLVVQTEKGRQVTLPGMAVGVPHPMRLKRILSTGTTVTAANITLLFSDF